jgi:hypothetical protein
MNLYIVVKHGEQVNASLVEVDKSVLVSPNYAVNFVLVEAANRKHALVKGERIIQENAYVSSRLRQYRHCLPGQ